MILTAGWFGALTGLLELAILLIRRAVESTAVLGAHHLNRHFLVMVPLGHVATFLVVGAVAGAVSWLAARAGLGRRRCWSGLVFTSLSVFALLKLIPGLRSIAACALAVGVGFQVHGWLSSRETGFRRVVRATWPALAGIIVVLGVISYDRVVLTERRALHLLPAARVGMPNVLLVVLDTVRADHLSVYGYERDTTPNLARLARRGVVFQEARAPAPWTLPSHASLFTGRWPHETGVAEDRPLDDADPTLAEYLAGHGYATAGFVANTYFCNSWYGLGRGFAHYEDYYDANLVVSAGEVLRSTALGRWLIHLVRAPGRSSPRASIHLKNASEINDSFLRWLAAHPDRPFFAFLNYLDTHDPYKPPPEYAGRHGRRPETPADIETLAMWHHERKAVSPHEVELLRDAYDDCLSYLDDQLGVLFDQLERQGVLDKTLVVITSDHGEELGEHGLLGHGKSLYRPEIRVPLIVLGPTGVPRGATVTEPVTLRDVAATVAEQLGLPGRAPFPGRSLARYWDGGGATPTDDEAILSEVEMHFPRAPIPSDGPAGQGPMASVLAQGNLYIRGPGRREELYHVESDPDEQTNLSGAAASQAVLRDLRERLDRLIGKAAAGR
jgi:arylsulfatase A-like enzyme